MNLNLLRKQLAGINDQAVGLLRMIQANERNGTDKTNPAHHRIVRRHETLLLERVRVESAIRSMEGSDDMAFAQAFRDVANAYMDADEFDRLTAITHKHMEEEVSA